MTPDYDDHLTTTRPDAHPGGSPGDGGRGMNWSGIVLAVLAVLVLVIVIGLAGASGDGADAPAGSGTAAEQPASGGAD